MILRDLREARLLTQRELSELTGVTHATISRIESGLQRPEMRTLRKLAAGLGVEPEMMAALRKR